MVTQNLEYYKSRFYKPNIGQDWISFNNAGLQPITLDAKNELQMWAERFYKEGYLTDQDYANAVEVTRGQLAKLIGCETTELAFFASTAGAINQIAWQLPIAEGSEVVLLDQDYPSLIYPWEQAALKRKLKIVKVLSHDHNLSFSADNIIKSFNAKTAVLAISWYQYQNGATCDFERVLKKARELGIFVLLDVMQGLGIQEFSFWSQGLVDAIAGGSHKWLSSPVGVGFLAIRAECVSKIAPHNIGSLTYGSCDDVVQQSCVVKQDATRFEPASKAAAEIAALGKSLELIHQTSTRAIRDEALRLAEILHEGLLELGYRVQRPNQKREHSFINFEAPKIEVSKLSQYLNQRRILHVIRNQSIRLSLAGFNRIEEVEYTIESLRELKLQE